MSYSQYGKVQATDFNALAGQSASSAATLNAIWGVGSGDVGYGQTPIDAVAAGGTVSASNWDDLINTTVTIATHQGTAISAIAPPAQGSKITFLPAAASNLTQVYNRRTSAIAQGSTSQRAVVNAATWFDSITFTHTVTFESGDHARYFFNAGGQIKINFSHPSGDRVNALFNSLTIACGTLAISAMSGSSTPQTASINGLTYDGVTKVGGTGTPVSMNNGSGYYGLMTDDTEIFRQVVGGTPAKYYSYVGSYISVKVKSNGTQGSNGDNGSVLTITTKWDQVPNGVPVSTGSTTTVIVQPPSTTYLTKSWGDVVIDGNVTGS